MCKGKEVDSLVGRRVLMMTVQRIKQCSSILRQREAAVAGRTLKRQIQNVVSLTQGLKVRSSTHCAASVALGCVDKNGASMSAVEQRRAVETTVADVDRNQAAETQDDNSLDKCACHCGRSAVV